MKQNTTRSVILQWMISLSLILFSISSLIAQSIEITTDEHNNFYFSIIEIDELGNPQTYLNSQDLVYYHFSDGVSLQSISNSDNPNAKVTRQFKNTSEIKVIAYVARKNGPLEFAPGIEVPIPEPCTNCEDPLTFMPEDKSIKLSTSWAPFISSEVVAFDHNISNPPFDTPAQAWFFLNLHVETGQEVIIQIPEAFSVEGVIINKNWAPLQQGGGPIYGVALGSEFESVEYTSTDHVAIRLIEGSISGQAQLSLLLLGNPGDYINTTQIIESTLIIDKEQEKFEKFDLKVRVSTNPHDPNKISTKDNFVCTNLSESNAYRYRVDYQNLGQGFAEDVVVIIDIDETIMDAFSINDFNINSSHTISSIDIEADQIIFNLEGIDLPGLEQQYPYSPTLEDTKGTIRFKLKTHSCLEAPEDESSFFTSGLIKFICCYDEIGQNPFIQDTPMNSVEQKTSFCGFDPLCLNDFPETEVHNIQDINIENPFPNPFNDRVSITLNFTLGPVEIRITDANGIIRKSLVFEQANDGQVVEIDTQNLSTGTYFISIIKATEVITYMIVKQ